MELDVLAWALSKEITDWALDGGAFGVVPCDAQDHLSQMIAVFGCDREPKVGQSAATFDICDGESLTWIHVASIAVVEIRVRTRRPKSLEILLVC